jgi:hypothetical protein
MELRIEPESWEYIKRKSQERIIMLDVLERPGGACSCVGGQTPCHPSVRVGKPKNLENYEQTSVEGITVYYRPALARLFSRITIKIEKLLFIKFLVASGDVQRQL